VQKSTEGVYLDSAEVDMGPPGFNIAFEIYLIDRTFTLYSNDQKEVDMFVNQINELLNHKQKVLESQKNID